MEFVSVKKKKKKSCLGFFRFQIFKFSNCTLTPYRTTACCAVGEGRSEPVLRTNRRHSKANKFNKS